jgi:hypothetical protein
LGSGVKEWVRYTMGVLHRPNMARKSPICKLREQEYQMGVEDYLGEVGPGSSPVTSYTGHVREGWMNDWGLSKLIACTIRGDMTYAKCSSHGNKGRVANYLLL